MRSLLALLLWLLSCSAAFAGALNYDTFSGIPIQHEGRIKPLYTFALVHLQKFHGSDHIDGMAAAEWLAQTMFDPAKAMHQPLFLLKDTDAQAILNLPQKPDHLYNFAEATAAISANRNVILSLLQIPPQELSPGQRAVMELYENTGTFTQIMLSCTLFLPLAVDLPAKDAQDGPPAFIDYYQQMPQLEKKLKAVVKRKGSDIDRYTPEEIGLAEGLRKLTMTLHSSEDNTLLRIIPPQWGDGNEWFTPWTLFHSGQGSPRTAELMQSWRRLALAYQQQDRAQWRNAASKLAGDMQAAPGVRPSALSLEIMYYRAGPLGKSLYLYLLGLLLALYCISGAQSKYPLRQLALGATGAGAFLHTISIAARMYILERPPVGTLYESLLFVSLIAVLFGLFLEWRLQNFLGLLVAAIAGSVLLFASQGFGGDDTMGMLVAVLNTNFWLATHVLCITTGYGFGLVAGIIAHAYLIMRLRNSNPDRTRQILRGGYGTALIALLFTSLGTILGGIWADQSWGRFWGWDPKENGALLICLWLIWILHGRIIGRMHETGFAAAMVLLNIVIALSWLGVNLLSTGLHSYGFTDKAAWSLALFCAAELSFAAAAYFTLTRREHAEPL